MFRSGYPAWTQLGGVLSIPLDNSSLMLIYEALNVSITGEDSEGNPTLSGEFTLPRLLEFWSGDITDGEDPVRFSKEDLIRALVVELWDVRDSARRAVVGVLEDELDLEDGVVRTDLNTPEGDAAFHSLVDRILRSVFGGV